MKRILLTAVALTAFAGVAQAQTTADNGPTVSRTITVLGEADAFCGINGTGSSIELQQELVDSDARVRGAAIQDEIVSDLTALGLTAFCNGANNTVNLQRSALVLSGGSRDSFTAAADPSAQFAQAVIYDLSVNIQGAVRGDGITPLEGTSDGNTGPTPVRRFGATGTGAPVSFTDDTSSGAANVASAARKTTGGDFGPTTNYDQTNRRLAAGNYSGEVRLELTPGV